ACERGVVGIDGQRDLHSAAPDLLAERARGFEAEVPRRRRKEHESYHVSASVERRAERLARGQTADFDKQGHELLVPRISRYPTGRVLQRRALLVSPGRPVQGTRRGYRKALRVRARRDG